MTKLIHRLRDREDIKRMIAYLVLFWGSFGLLLRIGGSLLGSNPLGSTVISFLYFTIHSNIIITVIAYFYLFTKKRGPVYTSFAFIGFVNILITGIVFHALLTPFTEGVSFLNHILHTITPILYTLFYIGVIKEHLPIKKFYMSLIYPIMYMLAVYLLIEPIFGDLLDTLMPDFVGARYVYPFLDPRTYQRGFKDLLIFNLGILAPVITLFSFLLSVLKQQIERRISQNLS